MMKAAMWREADQVDGARRWSRIVTERRCEAGRSDVVVLAERGFHRGQLGVVDIQ